MNVRIEAMLKITDYYPAIWDLFCDHGKIGYHFYLHKRGIQYHFVDHLAHIIDHLQKKWYFKDLPFHFHHAKVEDLQIDNPEELLIFAGVGADKILNCIDKMTFKSKQKMLLCANKDNDLIEKFIQNKRLIAYDSVLESGWQRQVYYVEV